MFTRKIGISILCYQPKGYVTNYRDCDDLDASIGEGTLNVYYRDLDGDGYEDANFVKIACQPPKGYSPFGVPILMIQIPEFLRGLLAYIFWMKIGTDMAIPMNIVISLSLRQDG